MALSIAQVASFKETGLVLVPDFWHESEVRAMQGDLKRLVEAGLLRNVATEGDGKTASKSKSNLQICPIGNHSPLFRAAPFAPKVIEAVTQLIGEPFFELLDQIFLKPARAGAPTNWHQDNGYFSIADPTMGVGMWTAVHEANEANGTMRLIPGTHRVVYEHTRDPDSDHHVRCYPPEDQAIYANLPAGGCVFFCFGIAHATGANQTDRDRAGLALHFLRTDHKTERMKKIESRSPHIRGPLATGGLQEYGIVIEGTWEHEVDAALQACL